jgi:type I restriction enzyme M protein
VLGGRDKMRDTRFKVMHKDEDLSLVTRSSDGQLLFLANMASKMNHKSALGSRVAEVHNGSSLFTGDAGQGESNIRRWLIENDWVEAIVALPLNLFYNTGIATYVWVLSNRKAGHRKGQVQLIDASQWFRPLRKNLGKKNCNLSPADIERISRTFLDFKETSESKIFPNAAFGYWKVTVERPLRLHSQLTVKAIETLRFTSGEEDLRSALYEEFGDDLFNNFDKVSTALEIRLVEWSSDEAEEENENGDGKRTALPEKKKKKLLDPKTWARDGRLVEVATKLRENLGDALFEDHNVFRDGVNAALEKADIEITGADLKRILNAVSWRVETAPRVIAKVHRLSKIKTDPLHGLFEATVGGKPAVVQYDPDSELRDSEQVPLLEEGGIEAFIRREVLPYTSDAWIKEDAKIGYEVSFTRHFYKPQPLRTLEEISADILLIEQEAEGRLDGLLTGSTK